MAEAARSLVVSEQQPNFDERRTGAEKEKRALHVPYIKSSSCTQSLGCRYNNWENLKCSSSHD